MRRRKEWAAGFARRSRRLYARRLAAATLVFASVLLQLSPVAQATSGTWNGTAGDGMWVTPGNWTTGVPGATTGTTNTDTATFNIATGSTITLDAGRNLQNISFDTAVGSFTIGGAGVNAGNALLLTSGGAISLLATATGTALTETFNAPITLEGNYSFTNAEAQVGSKLVFAGNISNAAASTLSLTGAGTGANVISGAILDGTGVQSLTMSATAGSWTLSGANNYSGLTTISGAGTLILSGTNSSAGQTTLSAGTLQLKNTTANNGGLASGAITITATSAIQNTSGSALAISNAVNIASTGSSFTGSGSLTINGATTFTVSAKNIVSSITTGGVLTMGNIFLTNAVAGGFTDNFSGTGLTVVNGVIADFSGGAVTAANAVVYTGTALSWTLNGANTYTGLTTVNGTGGTLILAGSNNTAGGTTITAGTLQLNSNTNGGLASGLVTLNGGILQPVNAARTISNAVSVLLSSTISGSQDLTINGTATVSATGLTLTSSDTSTNGVTFSGPNFFLSNAASGANTLTIAGTGKTTINGSVKDSSGAATGTSLTYSGSSSLVLNGIATYTGPTAINSGTVFFNAANTGVSAVTVGGTAGGNATLAGSGTVPGTVTFAAGTAFTGAAINPGTVGGAGTITLSNATGFTTNAFSRLNFDLGSATTVGGGVNDLIASTGLPSINGLTQVNINTLGTLSVGNTYTLVNGYSGTIANFSNFSLTGAFTGVDTSHSGVLRNNAGALQLVVTAAAPTTAFWSGAIDSDWSTLTPGTAATNWRTSATSNADTFALPGSATDVHFVTTTPAASTLATTLGIGMNINSLTFDSSVATPASVAGPGTLTISGAAGMTVNSAAGGAVTISAPMSVNASQTWTNNNTTNPLTISGAVSVEVNTLTIGGAGATNITSAISGGSGGLSKIGSSTLTLSGLSGTAANNYGGATIIDAGILAVTNTAPVLSGTLNFGLAAASVNKSALDLSAVSATFTGLTTVQTNSLTANTITIGNGKTLTLNGGLTVGYSASSGAATNTLLTTSGLGALAVNGTTLTIGPDAATGTPANSVWVNHGTLDASALASFSANVTNLNLGVGTLASGTGVLTLSNTANTILATTITVGDTGANNGSGNSTITLGTGTNVIQADTINVGRQKGSGNGFLQFASQTAGSPGTLTLTNKAGTGGAAITIANLASTNTGGGSISTVDLRGHVVNVTASTLIIGTNAGPGLGGATGTLSFDTGTFTATTLTVATVTSSTATAATNGILNIGGGAFTVSGVTTLTNNTSATAATNVPAVGTINLSGGSLTLATLNTGTKTGAGIGSSTANINVSGGSLTVNNGFTFGSQTTAGTSVDVLSITGGTVTSNVPIVVGAGAVTSTITLNGTSAVLDLTGHNIGATGALVTNINLQAGTLQNIGAINGGAAVNKTNATTLTLAGNNSGFTSPINVNGGTLVVSTNSGSGLITVNGSGTTQTLSGAGTIGGGVTLATGTSSSATGPLITPGGAGVAGTLTINGALTTNANSRLNFDLNTATTSGAGINDLISTAVLPVFSGATLVTINSLSTLNAGSVYTLIGGYSGTVSSLSFSNLTLAGVSGSLLNVSGAIDLVVGALATGPTAAFWAGAVDNNWNTGSGGGATNWRTDVTGATDSGVPASNTDVHFVTNTVAPGPIATTLGANFVIQTLSFDANSTSPVTIAGPNTLSIIPASASTGITLANGAAAVTISAPLFVGATQTWNNNSGNTLTVGTVSGTGLTITGNGGFVQTGSMGTSSLTFDSGFSGTANLNQANTVSGALTVGGGTVIATSNAGALGVGTLTLSGGALKLTNPSGTNLNFGRNTTVSTNYTITTDVNAPGAGDTFTLGSLAIGAQVLTIAGGPNVTSGVAGVTFGGATLSGAPTFTITNPAGGGVAQLSLGAVNNGAFTATIGGNGNVIQTGAWGAGAGGITYSGSGTLTLNQANTFTGTLTISSGIVAANSNAGALGAGALSLGGGTLDFNSSAGLNFGRATTVTANAAITAELNAPGTGVIYTLGTLAIGGQTLTIGGGNVNAGTAGVTFGAVTLSAAPTFTTNNPTGGGVTQLSLAGMTGAFTPLFNGSGNVIQTGAWANGVGGVTYAGTGTLALSQSNTFTGTLTINSGTVTEALVGNLAAGSLVLGGAATSGLFVHTGVAGTLARTITLNAGGGEIDSTTATLTLPASQIALTGPLTVGGASNVTLATAAVIPFTGTSTLIKTGAGTFTINTTGGTAVSAAAMPIVINSGVFTYGFTGTAAVATNLLGTGTILITPGATATNLNISVGGVTDTITNPVTIANATGVAAITNSGGITDNGTVTFAPKPGAIQPIFRLQNTNGTLFTLTMGGAFSGPGDLQFNPSGTNAPITVSGAQNELGAISNVGTATAAASLSLLSGTVGAGITSISQAGSNPFTVSSPLTLNSSLNTFVSTGSGLFTLSGAISGVQPLTLQANSTGGITVGAGAVGNTGSITNSGTGTGTTTISGIIGATVTGVVQNGTSPLTLSGVNTFTSNTLTEVQILAGTLNITADTSLGAAPTVVNPQYVLLNGGTLNATASLTLSTNRGIKLGLSGGTISTTAGNFGGNELITDVTPATPGVLTVGAGAGQYIPGGQSTYAGGTIFANGSIVIPQGLSTGPVGGVISSPLGAGTLTFNPTASIRAWVQATGGDMAFNNNVALNGGVTFTGAVTENNFILNGPIALLSNSVVTSTVGTFTNGKAAILNGPISGSFSLTKAGTGNLTLGSSSNAYTGPTVVTGGYLNVAGTLPNGNAITIAPATASGTYLNFINGVVNTPSAISLLTVGNATGISYFGLDLGTPVISDTITTAAPAVTAGLIDFNIAAISGFGAGTYTLLSAPSGLTSTGATYALGTAPGGFHYAINSTDSAITLVVSGGPSGSANTLFWRGALNNSWGTVAANGNTNFTTDLAGSINANTIPDARTTVTYSASNVAAGAVSTTLDGSYTINDLVFTNVPTGVTSVTVASGGTTNANTLTLTPASPAVGITLQQGAGAVTISAPITLGAAQTWSVDGTAGTGTTSSLTVSGPIGGAAGAGGLTLAAANASTTLVTLSGVNTYSGPTTINSGVTVQIGVAGGISPNTSWTVNGTLNTNGFAQTTGSLGGTGLVQNNSAAAATLTIGNDNAGTPASPITFSGTLQNGSTGLLNITKVGTGNQVFSGPGTYTGVTNVNTGTLIYGTGATSSTAKLFVGVGGASAAVIQRAGTTLNVGIATINTDVLSLGLAGGYGYYLNNGGTLSTGQLAIGSGTGGTGNTGVFEQNGGSTTVTAAGGYLLTGWSGTNANGILNIFNGTITNNSGVQDTQMGFGASLNSFGMFNLLGPGALFDTSGGGTARAVNLAVQTGNFAGVLNLNAGTLLANAIKTSNAGTPTFLDFNGGTLKANSANGAFVSGITAATIYAGGATIDSNGFAVTIPQAFLAPTGSGLTTIPVASAGAGYIGAPAVRITGGGGTGATAIAVVDLNPADATYGQVTGFTITSAGNNYTSAPMVTLIGGGAATAATPGTATLAPNATTGVLTKIGLGTLTLSAPVATSTFTGGVVINNGTLALGANSTIPAGNIVTVNTGGTFDLVTFTNTLANVALNGGTLTGTTGVVTATNPYDFRSGTASAILAGSVGINKTTGGTVTLSGVNTFTGTVNVTGGTLSYGGVDTNLGAAANTVTLNGGALQFNGSGNVSTPRTITLGASGGTLDVPSPVAVYTVTNPIDPASTGNLIKTGSGTVVVANTASWNGGAGGVVVNGGTLQGGFGNSGGTLGSINVAAAGNLSLLNGSDDVLTLSSGGTLTLASGAQLGFELGSTVGVNDEVIYKTASVTGASPTITLNLFKTGAATVIGTGTAAFTLLTSSTIGGLTGVNFTLGTAPTGYNYTINNDGTTVTLDTVAATNIYWRGGQDLSWNTLGAAPANWTSDAAGSVDSTHTPLPAETVVFSATGAPLSGTTITTTLDAPFTIDSLLFTAMPTGITAVVINPGIGGTLTLTPASSSGGILVATGAGNATIAAPLTLGASQTWNVTDAISTLTVSGNIGFGANLNKTGAGALTLGGSNTGAGNITLNAGTLNINTTTALGTGRLTIGAATTIDNSSAGAVVNANNNPLTWSGSFTFTGTNALDLGTGAVVLANSATVTTTAQTLTIGGGISDAGANRSLTKAGAGTLILNGNNAYGGLTTVSAGILTLAGNNTGAGGVTLSAGTLNINKNGALGTGPLTIGGGTIDNTSAGAVTATPSAVSIGGSFTFNGTQDLNLGAGPVTLTATPTITTVAGTLTLGGTITGGVNGLTKPGAGSLVLTGSSSTYGGPTNVGGGAMTVTGGIVSVGGALNVGTTANTSASFTLSGSGSFSVPNGNINVGSLAAGTGTFVLNLGTGNSLTTASSAGANGTLFVANATGSSGVVNQTGGAVSSDSFFLATGATGPNVAYGFYNQSGGTFIDTNAATTSRFRIAAASSAGVGLYYLSGGTATLGLGAGSGATTSLDLASSGTVSTTGGNPIGVIYITGTGQMVNQISNGVLTIGNTINTTVASIATAQLTIGGVGSTAAGLQVTSVATSSTVAGAGNQGNSTINLLSGGTLTTGNITKAANGTSFVNFNGGTLKVGTTGTTFGAQSGVFSYAGGATIDTNGLATYIVAAPILTPTLQGVSSIAVGTPGAGYVGAPAVLISGGTGTGATAIAQVSGGVVSGFVVTNFGSGYSASDVLTVTLSGGGASTPATAGTITFAPNSSGGLNKNSLGSLILTGASTYTGPTNINAGTLQVGNAGTTGALSNNSAITIGTGSVLTFNRTNAVVQGTDFSTAPITGAGSLIHAGTNALTLNAANLYTGGTTDAATTATGLLIVTNSGALGMGTVNLKANPAGATATFQLNGGITIANLIAMDSTTGREYISSTNGSNTLGGNITISAATTNANTLVLSNDGVAGTTFTVNSSITAPAAYTGTVSLRGLTTTSFGILSGQVNTPASFLESNVGGNWTINSTGNIWTITALNSTTVLGTLTDGVNDALATSAKLTWGATALGLVDLNGHNQTVAGLDLVSTTAAIVPKITNNGAADSTLTLSNLAAASFTYAGLITNGSTNKVNLVLDSAGKVQILSNANTYSGSTAVNNGTLRAGVASVANVSSAFGANSAVTIATTAGATLDLNGFATQIGSLTGGGASGGAVTLGNANLTLGGTAIATNFAGSISGSGGLIMKATGTQTLSGPNTYTGATAINTGTLNITGSTVAASAFTVSSGAFLTGTGTIGGTVGGAGTISPGTVGTIGTLNTGTLTLTGTFLDDVTGTTSDLIAVTGNAVTTGGTVNVVGTPTASRLPLITTTGGTLSGSLPTLTGANIAGYRLALKSSTELDLTNTAVIGTIATQLTSPSIITGGTDPFTITVQNSAPAGSANLNFSAASGTNTTGSIPGPVSVAPQTTSAQTPGLTFNGTAVGSARSGSFTVTDSNAFNNPLPGSVSVNVFDHATAGAFAGATLDLGTVHVGYTGTITSGTSATVTNGQASDFRVNLKGSASPVGNVSVSSIAAVAPGGNGSISALLANGQAAGVINQGFTYTFADESTLSGASASLSTSTITVTGAVFNGAASWVPGGTTAWGTAANWADANGVHAAPGTFTGFTNTDAATFGNAGSTQTVALNATAPSVQALAFNATNGTAYNLTQGSGLNSLTLDNGGGNASISASVTGGVSVQSINVPLLLNSNLTVTAAAGNTVLLGQTITGATRNITATGAGLVTLGGDNSAGGGTFAATNVNSGSLSIAADTNLGSGPVTLTAGALLVTNTVPNFTHNLAVGSGTNTLAITTGKTATITGAGSLTGGSSNTLNLGDNSGGNAGLLVVNTTNALAPAVVVSGGALGGNGTLGARVTLTTGTLTAGTSTDQSSAGASAVGMLTVGSLKLNGGTYVWKVAGLGAPGQAGGYDTIATSGNSIDLGGLNGTTARVTLAIGNMSGLQSAVDAYNLANANSPTNPTTPTSPAFFQLASGSVTLPGSFVVTGHNDVSSLFVLPNTSYQVFAEDGTAGLKLADGSTEVAGLVLEFTPVPEPVVTGVLGLAVLALVRRPRRRDDMPERA